MWWPAIELTVRVLREESRTVTVVQAQA
jgi:hypothetical protein